jgi:hypothetical protein
MRLARPPSGRPLGLAALLLVLAFAGCMPVTPPYSPATHDAAIELRARTLALVTASGDPFATRADEVAAVVAAVDAAARQALRLPNNEVAARQWQLLADPRAGLVGDFARSWAARGRFGAAFRREYAAEISAAFDRLICVETRATAASDCTTPRQGG